MEITKEDLQNGLDFWLWARDNLGKGKEDWPEFERIESYVGDCPFCSMYENCGKCPLLESGACCYLNDSPYNIWEMYTIYNHDIPEKTVIESIDKIKKVFQEEIDKL